MGTIIKVDVSLRKEVISNIANTTTIAVLIVVVVAIALMETRYISYNL
jgi:hypothetical protein